MTRRRFTVRLSVFQKLLLSSFLPICALFTLIWLLGTGVVPEAVRQSLGWWLSFPAILLFWIPATLGGAGFFEVGIGVGPDGIGGWVYTIIFWLLVCAGASGLISGLLSRGEDHD